MIKAIETKTTNKKHKPTSVISFVTVNHDFLFSKKLKYYFFEKHFENFDFEKLVPKFRNFEKVKI